MTPQPARPTPPHLIQFAYAAIFTMVAVRIGATDAVVCFASLLAILGISPKNE